MFERRPAFFRAEDGQSAGRRVEATVKWFNTTKGFGFVSMSDGSADAFLPMAALRRAGYDDVREGASIACEIGAGAKGPLVINVLSVDTRTAVPAHPNAGFRREAAAAVAAEAGSGRPGQMLDGAVKWYEPNKGYGFIAPDGGGKDIFVHVRALQRSGVEALGPGQRVRVAVVDGKKGLEADKVTLI